MNLIPRASIPKTHTLNLSTRTRESSSPEAAAEAVAAQIPSSTHAQVSFFARAFSLKIKDCASCIDTGEGRW